MEVEITAGDGIVRMRITGVATVEGSVRAHESLVNHPDWARARPLLVDLRDLDPGDLAGDDMMAIATSTRESLADLGPAPCALVVADPVVLGNAHAWARFAEEPGGLQVRIFEKMDEAEAWLRETPDEQAASPD